MDLAFEGKARIKDHNFVLKDNQRPRITSLPMNGPLQSLLPTPLPRSYGYPGPKKAVHSVQ